MRIFPTGMALATALIGLAACALQPQYAPKVDMTGHTQTGYDYDLDSCRADARQMDILKGGGIGLIAGAAAGAGVGAIVGDAGSGAGAGAAIGGFSGAALGSAYGSGQAALNGADPDADFIRRCLESRGYTLVDAAPAKGDNAGK